VGRLKHFGQNLSIQKTLIVYTVGFMLLATALSSISINLLEEWKSSIHANYYTFEESVFTDAGGRKVTLSLGGGIEGVELTPSDRWVLKGIEVVRVFIIPIFFGGCIILAAFLFYRSKLKKPIDLINQSAAKIADNDLAFVLHYDSKDEMGKLCASLETMRSSLENNYREMWRMMEERRRLNAVFAHDLRTPLTVLRGYSDFLSSYLPHHKVSEEKLLFTVLAISKHTQRIESYVDTMNDVQKLEDLVIAARKASTNDLVEQMSSAAQVLGKQIGISINVVNQIEAATLDVDTEIILRVVDNLLSNALRYAKQYIEIVLILVDGVLTVEVSDDGSGFTEEDLKQAMKAFYRNVNQSEDHIHLGLGLYVCQTLCEKHGGELLISNRRQGGAVAAAKFRIQS